jgi:pyridinium-3,5-bisthiocarboxylic acid mononucleotide nickel chelatase
MRIAYFDCFAGISGDMTLGALIDAGADADALREQLSALPLAGYVLQVEQVKKRGLSATNVTVAVTHEHHERHFSDIVDIIKPSSLSDSVKEKSIRIFEKLAEAEAHVHGCHMNHVHFHEVGAVDAIIDIVGAAICLDLLKIDKVYASAMPVPHGFVESAHGRFPLPAPATAELLRDRPVYGVDVEGELVTPTGAAIVSALASGFGPAPAFTLETVGYGAGKADHPFPNVLRVMVGSAAERLDITTEPLLILETNLDDLNPQFYDSAMDSLFAAGARDVFLAPIQMKKNRPGSLLSVLCDRDKVSTMLSIIFRETSTLGVRIHEVQRACLEREWQSVETSYGPIRIKTGNLGGEMVNAAPEYEDCRAAAAAHNVATKVVYEEAMAAFLGP